VTEAEADRAQRTAALELAELYADAQLDLEAAIERFRAWALERAAERHVHELGLLDDPEAAGLKRAIDDANDIAMAPRAAYLNAKGA
jgi:hypothetical protein